MEKEKYQKELYELSICCTGVSFRIPGGAVSEYQKQSGHEMQYQFNNGVVAFVDKYGDTYISNPVMFDMSLSMNLRGRKTGYSRTIALRNKLKSVIYEGVTYEVR